MRFNVGHRAFAALAIIGMALSASAASDAANTEATPAAANARYAVAKLVNPDGESVGAVTFNEPIGGQGVIVDAVFEKLPAGAHALHVHETGKCEAPDFKSAGGHFAPRGKAHGIKSEKGMHAGDLPNIHVPVSGVLQDEIFAINLSLDDALFDGDGAAVVVHQGPDDYATDPAGEAGPRIACGVIEKQ